jgi:hypothetical protein
MLCHLTAHGVPASTVRFIDEALHPRLEQLQVALTQRTETRGQAFTTTVAGSAMSATRT